MKMKLTKLNYFLPLDLRGKPTPHWETYSLPFLAEYRVHNPSHKEFLIIDHKLRKTNQWRNSYFKSLVKLKITVLCSYWIKSTFVLPQTWRTFIAGLSAPTENNFPFFVVPINLRVASLIGFRLGWALGSGWKHFI